MGKSIQAEIRKLIEACEPYEEYRKSFRMVYWNLLVVCGMENSPPLSNIMDWDIGHFRLKSKNEQKSMVLLHELEAMSVGYWQKCRNVMGEEQMIKEIKPILEFAAKTELDAQQQNKKSLQIFQDFFHNGYEKMRTDMEDIGKKTSDLEDLFATDPKKKVTFEKSLAKFKQISEKIYKTVNPIEQVQAEHISTIKIIFRNIENLNDALTVCYNSLEGIGKKKYGHDQGKMARVSKEEKKKAALAASDV
ncbi:unnamed protein product [Caenorhabditis angaria]|uniref:Uncharacterized protein n=1 Tax=Caenorhabditis angaria TaxID=860376 RepID=A0A9P1IY61_9PELO|nr:unnamed protein product [Caenorhabditis angaria]